MKLKLIIVSLVFLVALVLGYFYWKKVVDITEINPREGEVIEAIYGLGTVSSDKLYHLRGGLTFSLRKLFVREGDNVRAGDTLVQLDEIQHRSPIAGVVTSVSFKEGELVPPQVSIITVTNLESLYLEVSLEQQSVLRVRPQQKVVLSFESLRNEKISGVVSQIYPRDSQFIVRIDVTKWPGGVLPGMTADVAIEVGRKSKALLIPVRSIVAGQVTRVRSGKKERIVVHLGMVNGEWAEVISDNLTPEDTVLVRGP